MAARSRIASHQIGASAIHSVVCSGENRIFVAAADRTIKSLSLPTFTELASVEHHKGPINCLSLHSPQLVSASSDWTVAAFDVKSGITFEKQLLHTTLPVQWVSVSPDGSRVAIATEALEIRIVNIKDITQIRSVKGHTKNPRCVAWDPAGDYLVSSAGDGTVRVWDCREDPPVCVETISSIVPKVGPENLERLQICWHHTGKYFAVPGSLNDIAFVENETWATLFHLSGGHVAHVSLLAFSSSGTHLASVGLDSQVTVWDVRAKVALGRHKHSCRVTAVSWTSDGRNVIFGDVQGTLSVWAPVLSRNPADESKATEAAKEETNYLAKALFDDEAAEKKKTNGREASGEKEKLPDDAGSTVSASDDDDDGLNDEFVEDDDGAGYAEYGFEPAKPQRHRPAKDLDRFSSRPSVEDDQDRTECQKPFQPGSTPIAKDLSRGPRYLAFNMTGFIYTVDQHSQSTVHVEFHDRSAMRPFSFTDHYNFTLGTLGDRGALFACPSIQGNPSTVVYRPFDTWASKGDWTIQLNSNENVVAICLTTSGAVVGTDQRYLRFFSTSGVQTNILSLSGPLVSMTSFEDHFMVVTHSGAAFHGDQNLSYCLYNVETMEVIKKDSLPISPSSELTWIGFSENNIPVTYDSEGVLRGLLLHSNYAWAPLCDTRILRQGKQEWYWPIGVTDSKLMFVITKGGQKSPQYPNRLISELDLKAPFLALDESSLGAMEEKLYRLKIILTHLENQASADERDLLRRKIESDKVALQLIQNACKAEKAQRALDLSTHLYLSQSLDGAVKLAVHHHLPGLAERINIVKEAKALRARALDTTTPLINARRTIERASMKSPDHQFLVGDEGTSDQLAPGSKAPLRSLQDLTGARQDKFDSRSKSVMKVEAIKSEPVAIEPARPKMLNPFAPKSEGSRKEDAKKAKEGNTLKTQVAHKQDNRKDKFVPTSDVKKRKPDSEDGDVKAKKPKGNLLSIFGYKTSGGENCVEDKEN
ncbi:WD40 repeat-like protein [Gonapodya prolifera JEL478]|uniref:WD40 repeat-like protein n=1 Tax=Gonapodya prolifera (strain JEL478) TaxID=1344416 RepID=A0A139A7A8_GONPJ|nr:WD40 repeat-like protein [Gonapodya prolifera JEL478]|eukprot:KXS12667.1 WD40 repeat-like protein [Gonapodya prolifera JEL478]